MTLFEDPLYKKNPILLQPSEIHWTSNFWIMRYEISEKVEEELQSTFSGNGLPALTHSDASSSSPACGEACPPCHRRPQGPAVCHGRHCLPCQGVSSLANWKMILSPLGPSMHRGLFLSLCLNLPCLWLLSFSMLSSRAWFGMKETLVRVSLLRKRGMWKIYFGGKN